MIIAAGLSPAWQQILVCDSLRWGEVNRARQAHWCASGKVLNVGLALAGLQAEAFSIAPLGGPARAAITAEFAARGAQAEWIDVASSTRVCTTLIESDSGRITELVENAAAITEQECARFENACRMHLPSARALVFTGSIPAGTSSDIFARLLATTRAPAILDIRGPELLAALATRPLLVKPNREELEHTLGRSLPDDAALHAAMRDLVERGAAWVLVSQGEQPLWLTDGRRIFRAQPPLVKVLNTIGCGDCLAAGIAWKIAQGSDVLAAVQAGMAAAALNAASLLPARIDPSATESMARSIVLESV